MSSVAVKSEEVIMENAEYNSAEELDEELQLQLEDTGGESYIQYEHDSMERRQSTGMSGGSGGGPPPSKSALESEKRMRREIANSNERRRMQSINAGFQNLRALLPRHEGEKLSKAAILQQTSQYICELEDQKTQLLAQNSQLKRQLGQHEVSSGGGTDAVAAPDTLTTSGGVAIKKRKLTDNVINMQTISDSSDEGLGSMSPEPMTLLHANSAAANGKPNSASAAAALIAHNATKELLELKKQLEKERLERNILEDELAQIKQEQEFTYVTTPQMPQSHQQHHHHQQHHQQQQQHHHQQQQQLEMEQQQLEQQQLDQHHLQQQQQHQQAHPLHLTDYGSLSRHEVIEHTDNIMRDDELPMVGNETYVEIDGSVVVCSSIEELVDSETAGAADIITEDHQLQDEVLLSSHSSTESEQEVAVNAIAKVYAEGGSPASAVLQPILQAAIKATPKVEVERIIESVSSGINGGGGLIKVKTEKIEQPTSGLTRSRQNLETIVEAIRHLEGDHLFGDVAEQHKQQQQQQLLQLKEEPLALTTTPNVTAVVQGATGGKRNTLAELRPYLQLKPGGGVVSVAGNKQMTITVTSSSGNSSQGAAQAAAIANSSNHSSKNSQLQKESSHIATPTAILKVQTSCANNAGTGNHTTSATAQQITIISTALKQCRPGVIVAKQLS